MGKEGDTGLPEAVGDRPAPAPPSRQVGIDVRSRDAFELLQLGEAIVRLQGDLRSLALEKEDLRFERDRYRASAAEYQSKLSQALDEVDQVRLYREEAEHLRREVVVLARQFEERLAHEVGRAAERHREAQQSLHDELAALKVHGEEQLRQQKDALEARCADRLQREIVSLARECEIKLGRHAAETQVLPPAAVHGSSFLGRRS